MEIRIRLITLLLATLVACFVPLGMIIGGVFLITELDAWYFSVLGLVSAAIGGMILVNFRVTITRNWK